jgi:hypothetical protein
MLNVARNVVLIGLGVRRPASSVGAASRVQEYIYGLSVLGLILGAAT